MVLPSFPERVTLWKEGRLAHVDFPALISYLNGKREGLSLQGPLEMWSQVAGEGPEEEFAIDLARSRIIYADRMREKAGDPPLKGEVEVERRMLRGLTEPVGMLYDASLLAGAYTRAIAFREGQTALDPDSLHLVVTYRLIGTFDSSDRRYHARTCFFAFPSIVSTTGLVVAPAKPREYYLARRFGGGRIGEEAVLMALEGRFLDHEDRRTTEVMRGYLLQALFYHATGNPFCDNPECRLYNAHWQEEMLRAQLGGERDLCPSHRSVLATWGKPG
jgi:hypothetical protein